MLIVFASSILVGSGHLVAGAAVLAFGGCFDILDGALARVQSRSYPYGAFLDSVTDRYAEGAIYLGIAAYFLGNGGSHQRLYLLGAILALIGSFQVSYIRARAQSLAFRSETGLFKRPERIVATIVGLLVLGGALLPWVIWLLAVLTNFTALQRIHEVWAQARDHRRTRNQTNRSPASGERVP
jgi:CDP-diacylglycerol--glycerol-3-phosphate 3-phosphatidyltransferase